MVLKQGCRLFFLCFSDEDPGTQGPRRVSKKELHDEFAEGWAIESVEPSRYEVQPDLIDSTAQADLAVFTGFVWRRGYLGEKIEEVSFPLTPDCNPICNP